MYKKVAALFLSGVGLLAGSSGAVAADNLFKNYAYGTPMASYAAAKGYYDCSETVGGNSLCIDDVDFIGQKFTAALVFSGSKLIMVSLFAAFDQELYTNAIGALSKTFTMVAMADATSQLDLADTAAKSKDAAEFTAKTTNYESVGLNASNLTYIYIEGHPAFAGHKNMASLLASVPDNARSADLVIAGEGPEAAIVIRFSYPKLEANKVLQAKSKSVESF